MKSNSSNSRLSPLAPPFNPCLPHNLEGVSANGSAVATFPYADHSPLDSHFEPNGYHLQYPFNSEASQPSTNFMLVEAIGSQDYSYFEEQGRFEGRLADATLMPYNTLLHEGHCYSSSAPREGHLSHLYSLSDECIPSRVYYNSTPRVSIPSGACSAVPLLKPVSSDNVDSSDDASVINDDNYSSYIPTAVIEPRVLLNVKDKIVPDETCSADQSKEKRNGEPRDTAFGHGNKRADNLTLELCGVESGISVQISSVKSDHNDSDVDSPCWKGTQANQSAFGVSRPMSSAQGKIEIEAHKYLNPLAPQFFPGSAKQVVEFHKNKYWESDFLFQLKTMPSVVNLPSSEQRLTDTRHAISCALDVSTVIGTQLSSEMNDAAGKEHMCHKLERSSGIYSSFIDQSNVVDNQLASNVEGLRGVIVSGSVKDALHNCPTSVSLAGTGNFSTSSWPVDRVSSDNYKTSQGASSSTRPKLDFKLVINTMHDLSKLLVWNYSNDLYSTKEHDMIHKIIDNLYVFIRNEVGYRVSNDDSHHPCSRSSL